mmetsp:Transcript_7087/g.18178  ORF Transcript_7087/g.18178 Transcript_7087/m.18178 type:complete len:204 (+) Transcript_7087:642-1253(+)
MGRTKVDSSTIWITSLMGCTSSSAAARGSRFFPKVEDGAAMCEKSYFCLSATTSSEYGSASCLLRQSSSDTSTLPTPDTAFRRSAAAAAACPATSTVTSPPSWLAAVMVLKVECATAPSVCSARHNVLASRAVVPENSAERGARAVAGAPSRPAKARSRGAAAITHAMAGVLWRQGSAESMGKAASWRVCSLWTASSCRLGVR